MLGTLFVVATPIGNLEDLTFRALRVLGDVELIAAEDTRRTSKLLAHYKIRRPLVSLREHNESRESARLVARMLAGTSVALVSDAGTPAIADPGARLVHAARTAGVPVVPIPGPSAVAAAVSVSGFPLNEFVFMGFPPRTSTARQAWLERLAADARTVVFFEAPHRIRKTLEQGAQYFGIRQILVIREMTKIHESYVVHPNSAVYPDLEMIPRGEFTIVVGPASTILRPLPDAPAVLDCFDRLTNKAGFGEDVALAMTTRWFGISEQAAKKLVKKGKILVKQHIDNAP